MLKIVMMKGLPASGKSTEAKKLVAEKSFKRINRDDLRGMIDNGKWSKHNEKLIVSAEMELAKLFLKAGHNVVIDDCNLAPNNEYLWQTFAMEQGADFLINDFTGSITLDECIKRDQKRPNYVGEKVIKRMYNEFISKPTPRIDKVLDRRLPPAWVFDIDGTLALHDRSPYDYASCEGDTVNEAVRTILNSIRAPRNIFLVSGRPDNFREHTERWLMRNEIEYTQLYMRKADDKRNDTIIKREIYEEHIMGKYLVMGWFDDRLRVCREIHNLGLPLFRVGDPDADF